MGLAISVLDLIGGGTVDMQLNTFDQLAGVPSTSIFQGAFNYNSSYDERSGMPMIVFSYYTGDNNYMSLELPLTFHGSTSYSSCN